MENIQQMEEKNILKPKKLVFEPPMISVIHFAAADIITTSGGPYDVDPYDEIIEGEKV